MPDASTTWTVLPHHPIEKLAPNLWRVTGALPNMPIERAMTIARTDDGRLFIHNAVALEEEAMQEIEAWGTPAFIVVPNGFHRLDCASFKRRYPEAKVVCPAGSRKKVEQKVAVDASYDQIGETTAAAGDDTVGIEHVDGMNQLEGVMRVRSADGVTLVFNDLIFNLPHMSGGFGFVYKLMGSTGGPKITRIARLFLVKDKKALRAHLRRLADTPDLVRIVPGHGDVITDEPAGTLRRIASLL